MHGFGRRQCGTLLIVDLNRPNAFCELSQQARFVPVLRNSCVKCLTSGKMQRQDALTPFVRTLQRSEVWRLTVTSARGIAVILEPHPTLRNLRGKDEVLHRAIEYLENRLGNG